MQGVPVLQPRWALLRSLGGGRPGVEGEREDERAGLRGTGRLQLDGGYGSRDGLQQM